ncbi:hypothetical protein FAIPA1_590016 [Frankia sp. AiPs1]
MALAVVALLAAHVQITAGIVVGLLGTVVGALAFDLVRRRGYIALLLPAALTMIGCIWKLGS